MPRTPRFICDQGVFHVLTRGNNGYQVFHEHQDYQHYLHILEECKTEWSFYLYHYCLMPNHVHLIVETDTPDRLSTVMHQINLRYAIYHHKRYGTKGHLWQDRFKSLVIARDEYLLECGRYIEFNPVRAGLTTDPLRYPWNSYPVYALGAHQPIVDLEPVYLGLADTSLQRQVVYRAYVWRRESEIRDALRKRLWLGPDDFQAQMTSRFGRPSMIRRRGRPPKGEVMLAVA